MDESRSIGLLGTRRSAVEKEPGISAVKSFAITFIQSEWKGGGEERRMEAGGGKRSKRTVALLQMSLARSR